MRIATRLESGIPIPRPGRKTRSSACNALMHGYGPTAVPRYQHQTCCRQRSPTVAGDLELDLEPFELRLVDRAAVLVRPTRLRTRVSRHGSAAG